MLQKNKPNLVFAICHPDDEAIWVGGLLSSLSRLNAFNIFVVCLSGQDPSSPRIEEFEACQRIGGFRGAIGGFPLRKAMERLPNCGATLDEILSKKLGIGNYEVDLLVTHSPYGDEQKHPHHSQAFEEIKRYADQNKIPFAFFSMLPVPFFSLNPIQSSALRNQDFQVIGTYRCSRRISLIRLLWDWRLAVFRQVPFAYFQFLTPLIEKMKMLECYKSVGLDQHYQSYAFSTNPCEAIYVYEKRSYELLNSTFNGMKISGNPDLFSEYLLKNRYSGWLVKIKRLIGLK
jgi:LmbE family N-acetylglucosaminyl deacetylase